MRWLAHTGEFTAQHVARLFPRKRLGHRLGTTLRWGIPLTLSGNSGLHTCEMPVTSEPVDHQVTYVADPDLHRQIQNAVGEKLCVTTASKSRSFRLSDKIGPFPVNPRLATTWFDTVDRELFDGGAMLRCRGRLGRSRNGSAGRPSSWRVEARIPGLTGMRRIRGGKIATPGHLLLEPDDPAVRAVRELVGDRPLHPAAEQVKTRRLLFAGSAMAASWRPDFVIALDEAVVRPASIATGVTPTNQRPAHTRNEVELQIFTQLPWGRVVDAPRLDRFERFRDALEERFGLRRAAAASYQATPIEMLP